jgi:hypothetical protein
MPSGHRVEPGRNFFWTQLRHRSVLPRWRAAFTCRAHWSYIRPVDCPN